MALSSTGTGDGGYARATMEGLRSGLIVVTTGALLLAWFYLSVASSVVSYGAYIYQARLLSKQTTARDKPLTLVDIQDFKARLSDTEERCKAAKRPVAKLAGPTAQSGPPPDPEALCKERDDVVKQTREANAHDLVRELYSFDSVYLWPITSSDLKASDYTFFPSSILTLVLALAMGALGSTIFVTGWFLKELATSGVRDSDTSTARLKLSILGWVIFRPVLGMVTAVGVFVAYKAGQITLSGSTTNATEIELNPFLLSFFAIIAGLASESAIAKLNELAGSAFGQKSGPPSSDAGTVKAVPNPADSFSLRKAQEIFDKSGLTLQQLVAELGMGKEPDKVKAWIAGTEPIPAPLIDEFAKALKTTPGELIG
jgi:hypothetical protein